MIKDVLIDIKSTQGIDDDINTIELTTVGKFGIKDDCFYLKYEDSQMVELENITTHLYVKKDNSVIIKRTGALKSSLEVKNGVRNSCVYNTQQGSLILGIYGENVENKLTDDGGTLYLCYTIDSNLNLISRNTVNISIREV